MKSRLIVCAGIVTLMAVSWAQAQQSPFGTPATSAPSAVSGNGYSLPRQPGTPLQVPATKPTAAPYTQRIPGEVVPQDAGVPHYPYPPYPNPFYDESLRQNPLADSMDWLRGLPSNVVQRFSTFIDTTLFPKKPATHGGTSSALPQGSPSVQPFPQPSASQAAQPQGPQPSLPGLLPGIR